MCSTAWGSPVGILWPGIGSCNVHNCWPLPTWQCEELYKPCSLAKWVQFFLNVKASGNGPESIHQVKKYIFKASYKNWVRKLEDWDIPSLTYPSSARCKRHFKPVQGKHRLQPPSPLESSHSGRDSGKHSHSAPGGLLLRLGSGQCGWKVGKPFFTPVPAHGTEALGQGCWQSQGLGPLAQLLRQWLHTWRSKLSRPGTPIPSQIPKLPCHSGSMPLFLPPSNWALGKKMAIDKSSETFHKGIIFICNSVEKHKAQNAVKNSEGRGGRGGRLMDLSGKYI